MSLRVCKWCIVNREGNCKYLGRLVWNHSCRLFSKLITLNKMYLISSIVIHLKGITQKMPLIKTLHKKEKIERKSEKPTIGQKFKKKKKKKTTNPESF